jgi:hypothetical protein
MPIDATKDKAAVAREALVATAEERVHEMRKLICAARRPRHNVVRLLVPETRHASTSTNSLFYSTASGYFPP